MTLFSGTPVWGREGGRVTQQATNGSPTATERITLGGGCFWCIEAVYDDLQGILSVESGYAGGQTANPTYKQVCSGATGHAEVIDVAFDPRQIPLDDILDVFFHVHDPTTLNRQGADVGTQYRSVILYRDEAQRAAAEAAKQRAQAEWADPIVTEIAPLDTFYNAEDYHQEYFANNPYQGYCQVVIAPKVAKFRKQYAQRLKA
ncbi:MAG: peptide-methionine (S)-S-oxide reductase MsrA [Anaerolineae bacterium]|nr:peptide-methionine (S)-S-oxide reductase MsrA [Anaerolineae bacterium]